MKILREATTYEMAVLKELKDDVSILLQLVSQNPGRESETYDTLMEAFLSRAQVANLKTNSPLPLWILHQRFDMCLFKQTKAIFPCRGMHYECAYCKQTAKATKLCKGCGLFKYCGKECQRMHWPKHKPICQEIARYKNSPAM